MNKYEKISKLQELKENGTLSEAEFESEKQKVLQSKSKNFTKTVGKIILLLITIFAITLAAFFFYSKTRNNVVINGNKTLSNSIEIGTRYNYTGTDMTGYINFISENGFIMKTGDPFLGMERNYRGDYIVDGNEIILTITYDSLYERLGTDKMTTNEKLYTNKMIILEDGTLKFEDEKNGISTFDKNYNN